jgi:hypothetical protein
MWRNRLRSGITLPDFAPRASADGVFGKDRAEERRFDEALLKLKRWVV